MTFERFKHNKWGFGITIAIVALGIAGVGKLLVSQHLMNADIDRAIADTVRKVSATLLKQVDDETRMDAVTGGPGKRMSFFATLITLKKSDIDLPHFQERMRNQLNNNYRAQSPQYRDLIHRQHFEYRDKDGEVVATFDIPTND